jgi:hypothetical protein
VARREGEADYDDDDSDVLGMGDANFGYTGPQYSTVPCSTLLCCLQKQCDADVFAAINDSGLE